VLRQIALEEWDDAADFLDGGTWLLRWLVAFLRRDADPEESTSGGWDLRAVTSETPSRAVVLRALIAYSYAARTLYLYGDENVDPREIHDLCCETLRPRKLVGDGGLLDTWERAVPALPEACLRRREVTVLAFQGVGERLPGFREGRLSDAPLVGEFLRQLRLETEDEGVEIAPELLIEQGLVYVFEEDARVAGMILSNLSDGRYVHAGSVFVHPAYRRRGVGRKLAAGLGVHLRETLESTAILDVFDENSSALAAYRAAGYCPVGRGLALWVDEAFWEQDLG
jgi:ribosomal protein S18 acetylase RimI-like enzyme